MVSLTQSLSPILLKISAKKSSSPLKMFKYSYSMTLFVLLLECKDVRKIYFNALSLNYQWFFLKTKTQPNLSIMQGKIKYSPVLYYILSEILFYHWCVKMLVESLKSLLLGLFFLTTLYSILWKHFLNKLNKKTFVISVQKTLPL